MTSKQPNEPNVFGGSWSLKKLECVERYLEAYLQVMSNQTWANLWYIDAFSGDGYQRMKEELEEESASVLFDWDNDDIDQLVEGSSLRAIRLSAERDKDGFRSFGHFCFLEYDEEKLRNLELQIADEYPSQIDKCRFILGDANQTLPKLLSEMNWARSRAVTFIDPFATQLKWEAVEAFKGTCSDAWILFPLHAVLRMLPIDRMPVSGCADRLDKLFGSSSWRSIYRMPQFEQMSLFGEADEELRRQSGIEQVIAYTTKRYKTVFPEVNGPAILKSRRNAPLFALYSTVANNSEKAREISRNIARDLIGKISD